MKIYVDRIEDLESGMRAAMARVVEEGLNQEWLIPLSALPKEVQEGDWLEVRFERDDKIAETLRQKIETIQRELNR